MLIAIIQVVLCAFLVVVPGNEATEGTDNARFSRGVGSAIDKILKTASIVYASNLQKVYKKKGGYTQALKDFNTLVPTPRRTVGTTRWGDAGNKRVHLQNEFGKPVLMIRSREKTTGDITINKIEYF